MTDITNLYKDINNLSHLSNLRSIVDNNPYKYMNYNLSKEIPYPYNFNGVYRLETEKQNLHYQPNILKAPIYNPYDGKTSILLRDMNNRKVDVSGFLYDINDIPIRINKSIARV